MLVRLQDSTLDNTLDVQDVATVFNDTTTRIEDAAVDELHNQDSSFKSKAFGILVLAVLPCLGLGVLIFKRLSPPPAGIVFNFFTGAILFVCLLYILLDSSGEYFTLFLKVFLGLFSAACLCAAVVMKARRSVQPDAVSWLVALASITFFGNMHACTEVPFTDDFGSWVVYDLSLVPLASVTLLTNSTMPTVCAALGLCMTTWRLAVALFGDDGIGFVVSCTVVALVGAGLVVTSLQYAKSERRIVENISNKVALWLNPNPSRASLIA